MTLVVSSSGLVCCVPVGWRTISLYLVALSRGRARADVHVRKHVIDERTKATPSALTLSIKKVKIYINIHIYIVYCIDKSIKIIRDKSIEIEKRER